MRCGVSVETNEKIGSYNKEDMNGGGGMIIELYKLIRRGGASSLQWSHHGKVHLSF